MAPRECECCSANTVCGGEAATIRLPTTHPPPSPTAGPLEANQPGSEGPGPALSQLSPARSSELGCSCSCNGALGSNQGFPTHWLSGQGGVPLPAAPHVPCLFSGDNSGASPFRERCKNQIREGRRHTQCCSALVLALLSSTEPSPRTSPSPGHHRPALSLLRTRQSKTTEPSHVGKEV